ncbi:MAG: fumarylacetoacetate hydrolase family protein [Pseudomonadota bacterium]
MWHAIATYESKQGAAGEKAGLVVGDAMYDLHALLQASPNLAAELPADAKLATAIQDWEKNAAGFRKLAEAVPALLVKGSIDALDRESYRLCVPYVPGRIFGAASNYYEHAREMGTELAPREESAPYCFMKAETSVTATDTKVVMPRDTEKLDWEVELGVVIGKTCRNVSVQDAYAYVAGYTVFNDISARDLNRRSDYPFKHDWFRGKSHDTFGPMGPWLVPRDCIAQPQQLRMQLEVNGEMMQDDTAEGMIFNIAEQIAYLSGILTLRPGDLIATGTPTGVGMGRGVYLKHGDRMTATIEKIGSIRNWIVAA